MFRDPAAVFVHLIQDEKENCYLLDSDWAHVISSFSKLKSIKDIAKEQKSGKQFPACRILLLTSYPNY